MTAPWRFRVDDDWPKGAIAMTKNLDLLKDEPLALAHALKKLAEKNTADDEDDKEWAAFSVTMDELIEKLEGLNQPSRAADAESE